MTTVKAFNEMMGQFLGELTDTFPDEVAAKEALKVERTRETFDNFMENVKPYSTLLMQKNDAFFVPENKFVKDLNLDVIWGAPEATENTKQAIWQYIQTMFILGNTISMFPPETLSMIESAAEACAKNMQAQGGAMDEKAMMAGMNNMLTQMMAGGGDGLQALLGGARPPPRQQQKRASKPKGRKK
jgi:hypothetical protein